MNSFSSIFRGNPGLILRVAMCLGFPLVLALVGIVLRASEASLRPVFFMAGLMMISGIRPHARSEGFSPLERLPRGDITTHQPASNWHTEAARKPRPSIK